MNKTEPDQSQTRPRQPKYDIFLLFWHDWASDRRCEDLDSSIMNIFSSTIDLAESLDQFIALKGRF